MDVNLNALQDAGASYISPTVKPSSVTVTSAPDTTAPATDSETKKKSDTKNNLQPNLQRDLSKEELQNVAADLTKFMQSLNTNIKFSIHEKTGRMMVRVVDSNNVVLKEFPSHQLLDTIAAIGEYVGGLLDKKA